MEQARPEIKEEIKSFLEETPEDSESKVTVSISQEVRNVMAGILNQMIMTTENLLVQNKKEEVLSFLVDYLEIARRGIIDCNGIEDKTTVDGIFNDVIQTFYAERQSVENTKNASDI